MESSATRGPFRSMVVLGESTVKGGGWLANLEERWADVLHSLLEDAQEVPLRYHNAGVGASVISPVSPGYEASKKPSAAERLDAEVLRHQPDLVVIAYGLNDMRAGMAPNDFRRELEKLVERIRAARRPLIVLANVYHMTDFPHYPPFDRGSLEATIVFNETIQRAATALDCVYADVWSAEGQRDHVVHNDTVHANKIGNLLIAHEVFKAIVHAAPGIANAVITRDADTEWSQNCRTIRSKSVETSNDSQAGR